MDQTAAPSSSRRPVVFRDGLGRRCRVPDQSGKEGLEILLLRGELTVSEPFEPALRERVARLAGFQSLQFSRLKTVEHLRDQTATLVLVSETVPGTRLSHLLATAERLGFGLDGSAAWCLVRQLVTAIAALHEAAADVAHGAIAPERIIVTPDARLIVVEHALASALQHVRLSHEQLWKELRVACPSGTSAAPLDHRSDIMQIGVVALSLLFGRALRDDEYPLQIQKLADSATVDASGNPMPEPLRSWLSRALQMKERESFASAIEASALLDEALKQSGYPLQASDLDAFLARCQQPADSVRPADRASAAPLGPVRSAVGRSAAPVGAPEPLVLMADAMLTPAPVPAAATLAGVEAMRPPILVSHDQPTNAAAHAITPVAGGAENPTLQFPTEFATGVTAETLARDAAIERAELAERAAVSAGNLFESESPAATAPENSAPFPENKMWRRTAIVAAILTVISGAGWAAASHFFDVSAEPVTVPIDSTAPARAPLAATAPSGLAPVLGGDPAAEAQPVLAKPADVAAAPESSAAAAAAPAPAPVSAAPASGWINVISSDDVQVFENGALIGSSRGGRFALAAGAHLIDLVSDPLGYRSSRSVLVKSGETVPITVEFPNGTIALSASPWAEVLIDGKRVGETPIGNLAISAGSHEVVFRHPELGEQRTVATVTLTAPTLLSVDMRKR